MSFRVKGYSRGIGLRAYFDLFGVGVHVGPNHGGYALSCTLHVDQAFMVRAGWGWDNDLPLRWRAASLSRWPQTLYGASFPTAALAWCGFFITVAMIDPPVLYAEQK